MDAASRTHDVPWWRVGMVWLVLGGPAAVVVAAVVTAVVAFRGADAVVATPLPSSQAAGRAALPAVQARNLGVAPEPKPAP